MVNQGFTAGDTVCFDRSQSRVVPPDGVDITNQLIGGPEDWTPGTVQDIREDGWCVVETTAAAVMGRYFIDASGMRARSGETCEGV